MAKWKVILDVGGKNSMLPEDLSVPMQYCRSCPCLVTAAMVASTVAAAAAATADVVVGVAVVVAVVVHLHIEMLENDVFLL